MDKSSSSSGVHGPLFKPTLIQHGVLLPPLVPATLLDDDDVIFVGIEVAVAAAAAAAAAFDDDDDDDDDGFLIIEAKLPRLLLSE